MEIFSKQRKTSDAEIGLRETIRKKTVCMLQYSRHIQSNSTFTSMIEYRMVHQKTVWEEAF